jgi:hypothetical protein
LCNLGHRRSGGASELLPAESSVVGGVRERRGRLAADDRRGLVEELVVLEGLGHGTSASSSTGSKPRASPFKATPGHYRVLRDGKPFRKANGMRFVLPFSPPSSFVRASGEGEASR